MRLQKYILILLLAPVGLRAGAKCNERFADSFGDTEYGDGQLSGIEQKPKKN